jgi:hypothetical protein
MGKQQPPKKRTMKPDAEALASAKRQFDTATMLDSRTDALPDTIRSPKIAPQTGALQGKIEGPAVTSHFMGAVFAHRTRMRS